MLRIKNEEKSAELYISGSIVDDEDAAWWKDISDTEWYEFPIKIRRQLEQVRGKPLTIYINSYGGSVSAGLAMANMISRHDAETTAIIDGYCCSIATQIFFSTDRRRMPTNAFLYLHKPSCIACGTATEMLRTAEALNRIQEGLETTYKKNARAEVTAEQVHELVEEETWLTGMEAAELFEIELMESSTTMNCIGNPKMLRNKKLPSNLRFISEDSVWQMEIAMARAKGVLI